MMFIECNIPYTQMKDAVHHNECVNMDHCVTFGSTEESWYPCYKWPSITFTFVGYQTKWVFDDVKSRNTTFTALCAKFCEKLDLGSAWD